MKIREITVAMPVHPLSYAIGIALALLIISSPGLLIFVALAIWLGVLAFSSLLWSIVILILCWATLGSLGFLISTYLQRASIYTLNALLNLLGIALVFLPPVYYPEEMLGSLSCLALLFPTSNAAGLIRIYSGSFDASMVMIFVRWLILLATMIACTTATLSKAKWKETRKYIVILKNNMLIVLSTRVRVITGFHLMNAHLWQASEGMKAFYLLEKPSRLETIPNRNQKILDIYRLFFEISQAKST